MFKKSLKVGSKVSLVYGHGLVDGVVHEIHGDDKVTIRIIDQIVGNKINTFKVTKKKKDLIY